MYEVAPGATVAALQGSSTAVFTDDTIARILALSTTPTNSTVTVDTAAPDANGNVTVAAGTEVVFVASSDTSQTVVHAPTNAPVVIFQGKGGVIATFNDGQTTVPAAPQGTVERVVVGSSGNDHIIIADARNTEVVAGTGNTTVEAGAGNDTIQAGLGNSTIIGGTGHAIVELKGNAADYTVKVVDGHAVVTGKAGPQTTDISKIQFVQLDNKEALIFANDAEQAEIAGLYQATFGRTADANGLKTWFDYHKAGNSLEQIATMFLNSDEYKALPQISDKEFLDGLYMNTFDRPGEAKGVADWLNAMANGTTRAEVIAGFAEVAAQNIADVLHNEPVVVGSVTIISNIL